MTLWVVLLLDRVTKNRILSPMPISFAFVLTYLFCGYSWKGSFSFLLNKNFTAYLFIPFALFLCLLPIMIGKISESLLEVKHDEEVSRILANPEDFAIVKKVIDETFGNRQYVIPLILFAAYIGYRSFWFMPKFAENPAAYISLGHPLTFEYQYLSTIVNSFVFLLLGTLIWIAWRIFVISLAMVQLVFNPQSSRSSIRDFFLKLGKLSSEMAVAVMTTILLVPNFIFLNKYLPEEIWVVILVGSTVLAFLIFAGPIIGVHSTLEKFKKERVARFKLKRIEILRRLEGILFSQDETETQQIRNLPELLSALDILITNEERTSTWPLSRQSIVAVLQSLIFPLIVAFLGSLEFLKLIFGLILS